MLKCVPSACSMYNCARYKTDIIACATPDCPHKVHATLVRGGLSYLDTQHHPSVIAGVSIDNLKYKQRPNITSEAQLHEYYCESCSLRMYADEPMAPPNRYVDRSRLEHKQRFEQFENMEQKCMHIPENMSTMTLLEDHSVVRIRALGKGYDQAATRDISEDASKSIYGPFGGTSFPRLFRLEKSVLAVKHDVQKNAHGLDKEMDGVDYNTVFGIFHGQAVCGIFEMGLNYAATASRGITPIRSLELHHIFLGEALRRKGIGRFVLNFAKQYAMLLNREFAMMLSTVELITREENDSMNSTAGKCGFVLRWNKTNPHFQNHWILHLPANALEAQLSEQATAFWQHIRIPPAVTSRTEIMFAYVYGFEQSLCTARTSVQIPGCASWAHTDEALDFYRVYAEFERQTPQNVDGAWLEQQALFVQALSHEELMTLYTYDYGGDKMLQCFLHTTDNELPYAMGKQFYHTVHGISFVLFQAQIRKIYPSQCAHLSTRTLAKTVCTWNRPEWTPVLEEYLSDLEALFGKAPVLTRKLSTYGVRPACNMNNLETPEPVPAFSIDASIAAKSWHTLGRMRKKESSIFAIAWQPGSRLIFTPGLDLNKLAMTMQVRAFRPLFAQTSTVPQYFNTRLQSYTTDPRGTPNTVTPQTYPIVQQNALALSRLEYTSEDPWAISGARGL